MKIIRLNVSFCIAACLAAGLIDVTEAYQVPDIQHTTHIRHKRHTPVKTTYTHPYETLDGKIQYGIQLSHDWKNNPDFPMPGKDGSVTYTYGATLPVVVCSPLYVCSVRLQPGETVNQLDVGDAVRWKVTPAISGSGNTEITHLVIKPLSPNPINTNMLVVTDRRTYNIKLESRANDWMPLVSFSYPDEARQEWQAYGDHKMLTGQVQKAGLDTASLDFGFRIYSKRFIPWKPVRVYTDGVKTYIQFSHTIRNSEAPALLAIGMDGQDQMVNYRMNGDRYIVDKVLSRAKLVSGVGRHQSKVMIIREHS